MMSMVTRRRLFLSAAVFVLVGACASREGRGHASEPPAAGTQTASATARRGAEEKIVKSEDEWRKILTPEQYRVLREKGTERAFAGAYWNEHRHGVYRCAACGQELFSSEAKFESGTGWPSFWQPIASQGVERHDDRTYGMTRSEVLCSRCGGHLGHVFDDGPKPTGLRYCINSASLKFEPDPGEKKD